jgi:hypothetical protein
MSQLLNKIRSRGHWRVVIRPSRFAEQRVPTARGLYSLLQATAVQMRGRSYPHVGYDVKPVYGNDRITGESEWQRYLEIWRMYQSGQFVDYLGMSEDWLDQSELWLAEETWTPGSILSVGNAIFQFTEIYEFAARLANSQAGYHNMRISISVQGLNGRDLWTDDSQRIRLLSHYQAPIPEFNHTEDLTRDELITKAHEIALGTACQLFGQFGWEAPKDVLQDYQSRLWR